MRLLNSAAQQLGVMISAYLWYGGPTAIGRIQFVFPDYIDALVRGTRLGLIPKGPGYGICKAPSATPDPTHTLLPPPPSTFTPYTKKPSTRLPARDIIETNLPPPSQPTVSEDQQKLNRLIQQEQREFRGRFKNRVDPQREELVQQIKESEDSIKARSQQSHAASNPMNHQESSGISNLRQQDQQQQQGQQLPQQRDDFPPPETPRFRGAEIEAQRQREAFALTPAVTRRISNMSLSQGGVSPSFRGTPGHYTDSEHEFGDDGNMAGTGDDAGTRKNWPTRLTTRTLDSSEQTGAEERPLKMIKLAMDKAPLRRRGHLPTGLSIRF
ncbi:hypothetical protein I316_01849 [Kwoniella heveanensis BCC8398]|uniref:Uncharacterized protein n=1 Tax=Kwoniella heveanensis BCC8398 TaxID=1296120 RepID=A0A1B9GZY3_9TREE|nr:hypothetical protein I316_01849 [Kwoniella heveanensis BCC8398]